MFVCVFSYSFIFKQKTAYEMRISDWSSDVCSSDLRCESHCHKRGSQLRHHIFVRTVHIGSSQPGERRRNGQTMLNTNAAYVLSAVLACSSANCSACECFARSRIPRQSIRQNNAIQTPFSKIEKAEIQPSNVSCSIKIPNPLTPTI